MIQFIHKMHKSNDSAKRNWNLCTYDYFVIFSRLSWILLLASSLLFACSRQSSHWSSNKIHSDVKEYSSTKLIYSSDDPINGIDLEFIKIGDHLNAYLNVHSIPVPSCKDGKKYSLLKLEAIGEVHQTKTYRFEGGQRFLLSEEIAKILVDLLQENKDVTLILPGYRTVIKAEDFPKKFHRLLNPFPIQNPFHLPI